MDGRGIGLPHHGSPAAALDRGLNAEAGRRAVGVGARAVAPERRVVDPIAIAEVDLSPGGIALGYPAFAVAVPSVVQMSDFVSASEAGDERGGMGLGLGPKGQIREAQCVCSWHVQIPNAALRHAVPWRGRRRRRPRDNRCTAGLRDSHPGDLPNRGPLATIRGDADLKADGRAVRILPLPVA